VRKYSCAQLLLYQQIKLNPILPAHLTINNYYSVYYTPAMRQRDQRKSTSAKAAHITLMKLTPRDDVDDMKCFS